MTKKIVKILMFTPNMACFGGRPNIDTSSPDGTVFVPSGEIQTKKLPICSMRLLSIVIAPICK